MTEIIDFTTRMKHKQQKEVSNEEEITDGQYCAHLANKINQHLHHVQHMLMKTDDIKEHRKILSDFYKLLCCEEFKVSYTSYWLDNQFLKPPSRWELIKLFFKRRK